jgi:hypothetical protein
MLASSGAASAREVPPGLVAIGDVHGDIVTFEALLQSLGLINESGRWAGGTRTLVQTGDLLDRGAGSRQVMELLMRVEGEARAAGGRVTVLLGNHEMQNMTGDLYYRTREEFAAFAAEEDPAERAWRKEKILELVRDGSPLLRSRYYERRSRTLNATTFDELYPPGYFALFAAYSPSGRYGAWLRQRPLVHLEQETLFVHGGLSARFGRIPFERLNEKAREGMVEYEAIIGELEALGVFERSLGAAELYTLVKEEKRGQGRLHPDLEKPFARLEKLWLGVLFDKDGPLWHRGLAGRNERQLERTLATILAVQGARRIVIGHTRTPGQSVETRFGGRVVLIDTGMNQAVYGGNPSGLILKPDGNLAVWEN